MLVKGQLSTTEEEAENLQVSSTARKRSLFPKGDNYIILHIFNLNMVLKHKHFVFQSLMTKSILRQKTKKNMNLSK